jgi:hypothetical protein
MRTHTSHLCRGQPIVSCTHAAVLCRVRRFHGIYTLFIVRVSGRRVQENGHGNRNRSDAATHMPAIHTLQSPRCMTRSEWRGEGLHIVVDVVFALFFILE